MAARLIEASFPSPETILPDSFETAAHVSRDILADTAKFVEIFAPRKTRQVKLTFEDGHLELYATDPDTGEGRRALPIDYDGAEPTESVGMNCRYLRDALDCIDDDTVEVASRGAHGVFTLREPGNDDHLQLIMPMRL
jgi:DNA polymerase-3 subunit beta